MQEVVKLTQTVKKGGCAAKVAAEELKKILATVNFPPPHPQLLVDGRFFDDAAIYKISEDLALVQTVDFFTPIVDSPRHFGRIAACNALSDVYAMGGRPVTALGVLAFPGATMDPQVVTEVMQGACDLLTEAKANLVGGHSIDDDSLKFGLSVTGFVNPNKVWTNQGARVGDTLILTKPLGTGAVTAALKRQLISEEHMTTELSSMERLNNVIDHLPANLLDSVNGATDITGFGLSGHAMQFARASRRSFHFQISKIPRFKQAEEFLKKEILTKAHRTNQEYTQPCLQADEKLEQWEKLLLHDPQTSGGLLLSVNTSAAVSIVEHLQSFFPGSAIVGQVDSGCGEIIIRKDS